MYEINFSERLKTKKIPKDDYLKIREKIVLLAKDPRPRWAEKMVTRPGYRISIGNYRVIYHIDDEKKLISILAIDNRKDVYKRK